MNLYERIKQMFSDIKETRKRIKEQDERILAEHNRAEEMVKQMEKIGQEVHEMYVRGDISEKRNYSPYASKEEKEEREIRKRTMSL